jgi:hypothetical protein
MPRRTTQEAGTGRLPTRQRVGVRRNTLWLAGGLVALSLILLASACGAPQAEAPATTGETAPSTATVERESLQLPNWVLNGSEKVQAAYMAATLHAAELAYIPCYCSCGQFGHEAVVDCFISGADASGAFVYDNHASY